MAVKEKCPNFVRGMMSCCGGFRLFTRCGDREPPVFVCVLRAGLTRLQAKVKLKVAVWPRHYACWPIQALMASLKAYKGEESKGEKSLVKIRHRSLSFYWPATLYYNSKRICEEYYTIEHPLHSI